MMLEHLGEHQAASAVEHAIERVLADPTAPRTPELGGNAATSDVTRAIAGAL
jgi:tartrate dehydrogenase/decarboxylase / D-malate dehydrogenase